LLTVTAMEGATRFEADAIRNEKVKVLDAIRRYEPADVARQTVRGQYTKYRQEPGVAKESTTATWAAVRFYVDNWRWQGVPFYLRSGKGMSCRTSQILIQFRQIPHLMFPNSSKRIDANRLLIQVQPAEGIQVHFQTKVPDAGMKMRLAELDFRFDRRSEPALPEAYERLLLDTMSGDASLFARSDEVELAWKLIDPIQKTWDEMREPKLWNYEPGGWGPSESCEWIQQDGREWFDVCPVLG
jgi:glucose-6-phosphate 1-dehydrogenase